MDENLRQAVLGAQQIGTPTSTLGASSAPQLAQLYASSFQLPQSTQAAGALAQQAGDVVAAQKAAASAAKSRKSDYKRVRKEDGGFAFLDPDGNEISADEFARGAEISLDKLLSDSENPIDIGFIEDYNALKEYTQSKFNKGSKSAQEYAQKVEADVNSRYGVNLGSLKPSDVLSKFREQYPTVFGGKKAGVPVGQQFIPRLSAKDIGSNYGLDSNLYD